MSLKNLGTLKQVLPIIDGIIKGKKDLHVLTNLLGDMSEEALLSASSFLKLNANQLACALSSKGMTTAEIATTLAFKGFSKQATITALEILGLEEAEFNAAMANYNLATSSGVAAGGFATFSVAVKEAAASLWVFLSTNPVGWAVSAAAAIGIAAAGVGIYNKIIDEAVDKAYDAASSYADMSSSIDSYKNRIKELRDEIDSGTLSEEEAYQAKSELLSIQNELVDSYGSQVEGINLVNGALSQQLSLLDLINYEAADKFLNENLTGINKATEEMEKIHSFSIGEFNLKDNLDAQKELEEIIEKYGEYIDIVEDASDHDVQYIRFKGDASDAAEVLNGFMSDIRDASNYYKDTDLFDSILESASNGLNRMRDILGEYQDIYQQALKSKVVTDKNEYAFGEKSQSAAEWLSEYATAVQNYNDALSSGDTEKISEAAAIFNEIKSAIAYLSSDPYSGFGEYITLFDEIEGQLNRVKIAQDKFTQALNNGVNIGGIAVKSLAEDLQGLSDVDLKYALVTEGDQDGETQLRGLIEVAKQLGFVTGDSAEEVQVLIDLLIKLGYVSGTTSEGLVGIPKQLQEAFDLASEKTDDFLSDFGKVTEVLNQQSTGTSISLADYSSSELKDYTSALEYNNGALQLNADKVNELIKAKAEEQIAYNNTQKAIAQTEYIKNARDISKLNKEIKELEALGDNLSDDQKDLLERNKQNLKTLEHQNESILETCTKYSLMSASIREATGAYQHWLNAQSASQSGDMFDDTIKAVSHINDTLNNTKSEFYKRVGRTDYKTALDVVIPDTVDKEDEAAVNDYMAKVSELFLYDKDGNYIGLNTQAFVQQAVDDGLMVFDEATSSYQLAGEMTMEAFAAGLLDGKGVAISLVQSIFGELAEFGGDFKFLNYGTKTLGDLAVAADNAADKLRTIDDFECSPDIDLDFASKEDPEAYINGLLSKLNEMVTTGYYNEVEVDVSQIAEARTIIEYLFSYLQALEDPVIFKMDLSKLSSDQAEAITLLQNFKSAYNSLQLQEQLGLDTTYAEKELEKFRTELLSSENQYIGKLHFNTAQASDEINSVIASFTKETFTKDLFIDVDDSIFVDYIENTEFTQEAEVIYDVNSDLVDAFARDLKDLYRTVYYKTKYTDLASSGAGSLNGTAHAYGTAYAGGNWGTAPGGKTLVGEMGQEIVVDPHTGRWYTVGDNGAEFRDIPRGSIVFNHRQSESLLKHGYVSSRAHALVGGTAMLGGTAMYPGAGLSTNAMIDINGVKGVYTYDQVKPIGVVPGGSGGVSISKSDLKVFDWIEVAIERIGDAIDRLTDVASSAYKSLKSKLTASADAITLVTEQIKVQKVAYEQYMEAANSVGLSDNLKAKVQNGSIDLAQYDEDTQKLIEKYQEFYDKAQDSKKAVDDLHEELADLYSERFDNIQEDYNNQLEDLEHLTAMYESELSESRNVDDSKVYDALRDIETQKIELLTEELNDLRVAFQEAIDTGLIEVGSQAWHDMRNEIHGVNEELAQTKEQLANLYVEEFEEIQDDFDNKTEALDHAATQIQNEIDLLEAKGYKATQEHYEALQDVERERIKILKNELSDLEKTLADGLESGEISEGDDDWYDMKSAIEDTKEEIQEANIALEEYNQTMREMDWEAFDKQQKALSDTIEETNFQLDLLDGQDMVDESGNITSAGSQAAGYHSQNYNAYMKQADAYAKEIQRIDAELANDPNNDLLLERREELLEMQRDSILAAKDEKDAIADINEEIADKRAEAMEEAAEKAKEAAKKEAEAMKEALDKELEAMKKLVDSYTDALDKAKDLHDYRKKIADQTEAIGDIEKQLSAYKGDDSEETRATVQKLKDDLKAAKEDLKETEYDKYVSDQKQMLDDMYSQYEENINARIDQIDAKLEATINSIDSGFSSSTDTLNGSMQDGFASLLGGITSSGSDLGGLITDEIQSSTDTSVDSINGTISEYGDSINEDVANSLEVLEQIRDNTAGMIAAGDRKEDINVPELERGDPSDVPTINDDPPKTEQNSNQDKQENPSGDKQITVGSKINAGNALIYEYAGDTTGLHQYFDEDPIYTVLKEQNGYLQVRHHTATSGIDGWFKKNDVKAYRTGGLVDYDGLAMVHGGKKPELFLNPEDTENFMALTEALREMKKSHSELMVGTGFNFGSDFAAPYVSNLVDIAPMMSSLRDRTFSDTSSSFGDIQINIPIEHVDDYNDFIRQLKTDKKLEQIIQDMTIGRIASKNSLAKHLR